jgi:uncharacterized protein
LTEVRSEKVRFLSDPATYGVDTRQVEARETHMSWVFLTETRVYKLKKPIRRPHLDFSTIERRQHFCAEEVRLNRRLAAPTYLGVLPLCRRDGGGFELGGSGAVIDWLVEMARLPETEMLEAHIAEGRLERNSVERLAEVLASFYGSLAPEPQEGASCLPRLRREVKIDGGVLLSPRFELGDRAARLFEAAGAALDRLAPEIEGRARRGLIVEGHGDLRPEHVWLGEPLQIIDCLEFDRGFRLVDPHDEVQYLGLECAVLGAEWVRPLLLSRVGKRLGDPASAELLGLYAVLRALTRARLCLAHLLETPVRKPEKWRPLALRYLAEAERARLGGA